MEEGDEEMRCVSRDGGPVHKLPARLQKWELKCRISALPLLLSWPQLRQEGIVTFDDAFFSPAKVVC